MYATAFPTVPLLLIDLAFAAVMIGVGLAAGRWLFRLKCSTPPDAPDGERIQATLSRIRELASTVAQDVGEHTSRVQEITGDLNEARSKGSSDLDALVLDTVTQMVQANEKLQSQLATAEERLQQQAEEIEIHAADARTDQLTQLANRRAFDAELERRFAEWHRLNSPYSLFLIDVDHFKEFNDTYGHQAGDAVLQGVARVLRASMREMDTVCRYGGEEFAVILPATDGILAQQAAERARAVIEAARFRFDGVELQVTASVGLSEILAGEDNETLIQRADEALYISKEAGRNHAHLHDGEKCQLIPRDINEPKKEEVAEAAPEQEEEAEPTQSADTLRKLPDPKTFQAELRRRVAEAQRFNVPLSVLLVHVDNFKTFVAQYGDEVGELILDTVAQYLEILLRDMDLLARYSSGQFAVMLPGSSFEDSSRIAERIRTSLAACVIPIKGSKIRMTVSGGVATLMTSDDSDKLIERADAALTEARSAGHDCVYLHEGESSRPFHAAQATVNS